jgi:hypothetical protein
MSHQWVQITCREREALVDRIGRSYNGFSRESGVSVIGSRSDLGGEYGPPEVYTEWGYDDGWPVLRDCRWPGSDRPCEHYAYGGGYR